MASLYVYEQENLAQFLTNELLINIELAKYDIVFNKTDFFNMDEFTAKVSDKYNFVRHDLHIIESRMIKNEPHYHDDNEARMIVKGSGIFYFIINDTKLELEVDPGTFIVIPKKVTHYFKTFEKMTVLRFFSTNKEYEAIPVKL
jgi:cupin superfamily acireductone dioxygenase involved in methionine salvage